MNQNLHTERVTEMAVTQCDRILRHMKDYGCITQSDAINEYGCYRLAARINDLRSRGVSIGRRMKNSKNRYGETVSFAEYFLEEDKHE